MNKRKQLKLEEREGLVDQLLKMGNEAQIEKLLENIGKGDWRDIGFNKEDNVRCLYYLLEAEMKELLRAIVKEPIENQMKEAADVANFAHMIIHSIKTYDSK